VSRGEQAGRDVIHHDTHFVWSAVAFLSFFFPFFFSSAKKKRRLRESEPQR